MIIKIQYMICFPLEFVAFPGRVHIVEKIHIPNLGSVKRIKAKGGYSLWLKKD